MATWDFSQESTTANTGDLNSANALRYGNQPFVRADALASKRNVILTNQGWVRRLNYRDGSGNRRQKNEILVAAHPGGTANTGYVSNTETGFPDITQLYLTTAANAEHITTLSNGNISITGGAAAVHVNVVFNEPVVSGNAATLVGTATSGGSNETFTSVPSEGAHTANNIVVFKSAGTVAVGTYKIGAQTLGGTNPIENVDNAGSDQAADRRFANVQITPAVSNTLPAFTIAS